MSQRKHWWTISIAIVVILGFVLAISVLWPHNTQEVVAPETSQNFESSVSSEENTSPGIYVSETLASASSPGRVYTLILEEDASAIFSADYQNNEPPIVETGTWQANDVATITVTLTQKNGVDLNEPENLVFNRSDDALMLTNYDVNNWGEEGLVLYEQDLTTSANQGPLTGTSWQWVQTTMNDDSTTTPTKPDAFILTFVDNMRFGSTTDCNKFMGSYTTDGNAIAFSEMASTRMACLEDSQEELYTKSLSEVSSYILEGDTLILELKMDSGNMQFTRQQDEATSLPESGEMESPSEATLVP